MAPLKRLSTVLTAVMTLLTLCPDTALSLPHNYRYEVSHVPRYIQPYGLNGRVSDWGVNPLRTEFEPQEQNYDFQENHSSRRYPLPQRSESYSNPHVSYEIARLSVGQDINHIPIIVNPQSLLPGVDYEQKYESFPDHSTFQEGATYSHSGTNQGAGPLSVSSPSSTATNNRKEDQVSSSISQGIRNTISSFEGDHFIRNEDIISNADIDAAVDALADKFQTHTKRESPKIPVNNQQPIRFPSDLLVVAPAAVVPGYDHPAIVNQQIVAPYPSRQPNDEGNKQQYPVIPNNQIIDGIDVIPSAIVPNPRYPPNPEDHVIPAAIIPNPGYPSNPEDHVIPAAVVPNPDNQIISEPIPAAIVPISGYPSAPENQPIPVADVVETQEISAAVVPVAGYPSNSQDQVIPSVQVPSPGYPPNTQDQIIPSVQVPNPGYPSNTQDQIIPSVQVPNPGYPSNTQDQIIPSGQVPNPESPSNTGNQIISGSIQPISEVGAIDTAYPSNTADAVTPTEDSTNKVHKPVSIYPDTDTSNSASSSSNNDNSNEANSMNSSNNQQSAEQGSSISNNQNSVETTGDNNNDSVERTLNKNVLYTALTSEAEPVENPIGIFTFSRKRPVTLQTQKVNIGEPSESGISNDDVQTIDISQFVLSSQQNTQVSQIIDDSEDDVENLEVTTDMPVTEEYLPESETDFPPITESSITEDSTVTESISENAPTTISETEQALINARLSFIYSWNNEVYRRGLYFLRIENVFPETGYVYMPDIERYTQHIQSTPSVKFFTSHLLESYKAAQEANDGTNSTDSDQNTDGPTMSIRDSSLNLEQPSLSENDQAFLSAYKKLIAQFHPNMEKLYPLISFPVSQNPNPISFNQFVPSFQGLNFPQYFNENIENSQSNLVDTGKRPDIPGFVRPQTVPESDQKPAGSYL